ncbi:hypothetical protein PGB90_009857 [Kerria lacca]
MQFLNKILQCNYRNHTYITKVLMSNIKHSHDALNQIPKKPKKPASSFLRYLQSVRLELIKQNPSASLLEISKIAAQAWKDSDDNLKKSFNDAYLRDKEKYHIELNNFKYNLTDEQKKMLEKKEQAIKRKKLNKERIQKLANEWKILSSNEKEKYINEWKVLQEQYRADLIKWEEQIMNLDSSVSKQREIQKEIAKKLDRDEDDQKMQIMRKAFQMFDTTKSGFIETSKISTILNTMGQLFDDVELRDLINDNDPTGIGKVNFDGFCQIASHFLEEDDSDAMEEELREAFRLYDKEGNGYITTATLREILAALDDKLTSEDLDGIISEIDTDGSGTVDFDENVCYIFKRDEIFL